MIGENQYGSRIAQLTAWVQRTYGWHRAAFIALNVVITAINIWMGPPWWGIWPLLITGALFTLHFLFYKASVVDDAWVEDRAADLYDRSYDQGHIDSIANQHDLETPLDRKEREIEERRATRRGGRDPTKGH